MSSNDNTSHNQAPIANRTPFTTDPYNPENDPNQGDTEIDNSEDLIDWDPSDQTSPHRSHQQPDQRKNPVQVAKEIANQTDLAAKVQKMTFQRIERAETSPNDLMEVDRPPTPPGPLPSSGATPRRRKPEEDDVQIITHKKETSEVRVLSLNEKIEMLVKEHVEIKRQFDLTQDLPTKRTLLHRAQESQKSLQKLITNKEIESYVKGWNPWEAKRALFPPANRDTGKKRSSTSDRMRYNDPTRWAEVAEIALAVKGLYDHTRRRQ